MQNNYDSILECSKKYWGVLYSKKQSEKIYSRKFLRRIKNIFWKGNYSKDIFWHICERYLPKGSYKTIEIGSAPGSYLIEFHKKFGHIPYGVDFSEQGVQLSRSLFIRHNLPPENIIFADFLSDEFQRNFAEKFEIVYSLGVIEHYTNVEQIVKKHINLLIPGGILLISIPNFRNLNYILLNFFFKEALKMHNLNIMSKDKFLSLFNHNLLLCLYSGYFGIFNFNLFSTGGNKSSFLTHTLSFCKRSQLILDIIFKSFFNKFIIGNSFTSPYLIYIGRKK